MKMKGILMASVVLLVLALVLVYADFNREGTKHDEAEAENKTTIRILSSYELRGHQRLLRALADEYEDSHEGVTLEIQWIDKEDLKKEVCLGVDGKRQPDLVICSSTEMPGLINMEVLEDLTEDIAEWDIRGLIYPDQWQSAMGGGKFYGIPFTLDPCVLFCNQAYFEKKQLAFPQSWDEFFHICEGIEENGITCLGLGIRRSGDAAALFQNILYTCGGSFYSLDGEAGIRTLEILDTLKKWGYVNKNVINYTAKDMALDFAQEKITMMIAPLSIACCIRESEDAPEFQVLAIPSNVKGGFALMGDNIGVLKGGGEEARDFVRFLYMEDSRRKILEETGTLPLLDGEQELLEQGDYGENLHESLLRPGAPAGSYYSWFEMSSILSECVYEVLIKKNMDLEAVAYRLQDEIRVAIMRY